MANGLRSQIAELTQWVNDAQRPIDFACQFLVHTQSRDGILIPTGLSTPVYGGAYHSFRGEFVGPATHVLRLPCSEEQYRLIVSDAVRIESNGGRGSGKSEGGLLKVLRALCERIGEHGEISGPTYRILRIDWFKLLALLPRHWLRPGHAGVRLAERELHFVTGSIVRFASADNPDTLRSWGGSWAFIDEEQDVTDEAIDIIWPSLRLSATPQLWGSGTPKPGMYHERHRRNLRDSDVECHRFESRTNPFISHRIFDLAKSQMDERTYRQEILAEWVEIKHANVVFYCFDRARNGLEGQGDRFECDDTKRLTLTRCGIAKSYIIGVDYNWDYPNYAVIWKVFDNINWVAVDVVSAKGHAGNLAVELKNRGYLEGLIIDDASGRYNRGPKSSTRLLRAEGFRVFHPGRNPRITDRVDAALAKMAPVDGEPTLFVRLPECNELAEAFELLQWGKYAGKLDKSVGVDHVVDAATYPIAYFCPVGRLPRSLSGLLAA